MNRNLLQGTLQCLYSSPNDVPASAYCIHGRHLAAHSLLNSDYFPKLTKMGYWWMNSYSPLCWILSVSHFFSDDNNPITCSICLTSKRPVNKEKIMSRLTRSRFRGGGREGEGRGKGGDYCVLRRGNYRRCRVTRTSRLGFYGH